MSEIHIDDLTVGQLKAILRMAADVDSDQQKTSFVGKHVICRCESAGVHAGILVSRKNDTVILKNSRRLYYWVANDGVALSGVAQHGVNTKECKIDTMNPEIMLLRVIEIIPTTKLAECSINDK